MTDWNEAESRHLLIMGALERMDDRAPKLSETMQTCVNWMLMHADSIHRHPGGFWWEQDPVSNYRSGFGTATVQALVSRGVAEYTEWQEGRNGRFPIKAMLVSHSHSAFEQRSTTGDSNV